MIAQRGIERLVFMIAIPPDAPARASDQLPPPMSAKLDRQIVAIRFCISWPSTKLRASGSIVVT
jgi:hypothetical protein